MRHALTLTTASIALLVATSAVRADFVDTFDSTDAAWQVDRYAPATFAASGGTLTIGISDADSAANRPGGYSSTFYNTQGKQRLANVSDTSWYAAGDLFVSSDFASDSSKLVRTDLWTRDSATNEANAFYGIIGFINNDAADPFNASSTNRTFRLRVWDQNTNDGWVDLALPGGFAMDAWHNLAIAATPTTVSYRLDGVEVYSMNAISLTGNEPLKQVFLQAYNFGTGGYSVQWDNVTAVPEPASLGLLGVAGLGLLARRRMA